MFAADLIYASNEPKSVLARDLGDCRDNLRNSRSVFLIVLCRGIYLPIVYFPCEGYTVKSVQFNALKLLIEKEEKLLREVRSYGYANYRLLREKCQRIWK